MKTEQNLFTFDKFTLTNINILRDHFNNKIRTIAKKSVVKSLLPYELLQGARLAAFNKLKNNITEAEFVQFLQLETHGGDHVSYDYKIQYYNLKFDNNDMIIFTNRLNYKDCLEATAVAK